LRQARRARPRRPPPPARRTAQRVARRAAAQGLGSSWHGRFSASATGPT